jgi:mono/diheme cytochrome c family protein
MKHTILAVSIVALIGLAGSCGSSKSSDVAATGQTEKVTPEKAVKLFNRKCGLCHGKDGKKQLSGAPDLTQSELSKEKRVAIITHGKGNMPPFEERLSATEIEAVADYLATFVE